MKDRRWVREGKGGEGVLRSNEHWHGAAGVGAAGVRLDGQGLQGQ